MAGGTGSGCECGLQLAVGVQLDSVSIVVLHHGLEVTQVEPGKSYRSLRLDMCDAPVTVHAILHPGSGGGHCQALRIAKRQIIIGQGGTGSRIPGAARSDVINLIARIADDGAGVMDLDLMRHGGIERRIRDQQELAVFTGLDEVGTQRIAIEHFRRLSVHASGGDAHIGREIEGHRGRWLLLPFQSEPGARHGLHGQIGLDGGFNADVVERIMRAPRRSSVPERTRLKRSPDVEVAAIVAEPDFAHQDLILRRGIVQYVEVVELIARDRHVEETSVAPGRQCVVHHARLKTGDQVAQDRRPVLSDQAAHFRIFLRVRVVLELRQKIVAGSIGEDEGGRFKVFLQIGGIGEGGE